MIGQHDPRRVGGHARFAQDEAPGYQHPHRPSPVRRFLGGSPVSVFVRLLFLSILVGAVMAMLGLTPGELLYRVYDAGLALYELGLETFHDFGRWILAGAVIVVPLWLITRFFAMGR